MSKVAVSSTLLRWARERSGLSQNVLIRSFPKLGEWESGRAQPTLRQLEALSKKTLTPLGYFFLPEPPDDRLPIPDFRTLADQPVHSPSPNLLETVQTMQLRQAWMRDFLIEQGQSPLRFVGSARLTDEVVSVAQDIRRILRTSNGWAGQHATWTAALRTLQLAAEEVGILVISNGVVGNNTHRKLDPNEFRGFVLSDDYAPLVFINGADGKAAQMFTLAHEIAHVWFAKSAAFDLHDLQPANNEIEKQCNKVAAEFLIPSQELHQLWNELRLDPDPFQSIARAFKVSVLVGARRLADIGLITKSQFLTFYREYQEDHRRNSESARGGGNFYATQNLRIGRRFADAVVRAAKEGRILYRDAYQLTGLYGKTFDRFANKIEGNREQ